MEKMPKLVNSWTEYMQYNQDKTSGTIYNYLCDIKMFLNYMIKTNELKIKIDDLKADFFKKVTDTDINNFVVYCAKELNNSADARGRKVSSLRMFFQYLLKTKKVIDSNPVKEIEKPKLETKVVKYIKTIDDQINLIEVVDGEFQLRDKAILSIFLNTGIRVSELIKMDLDSIDNSILKVHGKGKKEREIPLPENCLTRINEYLNIRPNIENENAMFLNKYNQRIGIQAVQQLVKKNLKKANLEGMTTHRLRHTAASRWLNNDADIRVIQGLLGHENISTTERYTHISTKKKTETITKSAI